MKRIYFVQKNIYRTKMFGESDRMQRGEEYRSVSLAEEHSE